VLTPTITVLAIPYILVVVFPQNTVLIRWLSYIPVSAPTAMPLRVLVGDTAWWEPPVAAGILVVTTYLMILLAARIYTNSILRTGARTKWVAAFKGERQEADPAPA
jgi:ABC-2 type transport system permease protein